MGRWHGRSVGCNDGGAVVGRRDVGAMVDVVGADVVSSGTRVSYGMGGAETRRSKGWVTGGFSISQIFRNIICTARSRCRPGLSGAARGGNPEAIFGASRHHVGEGGSLLVASSGVVTIFSFVGTSTVGPAVGLGGLGGGLGLLVFFLSGGRGLVVDLSFELGEELKHAKLVGIGRSNVGLENGWGRTGEVNGFRVGVVGWNSCTQVAEESFDGVDARIGVTERGGSSSV